MQNKLYSTLEKLYNEIVLAKRTSSTLDSEIDNRLSSFPEIVSARDGFSSLKDRLENLQNEVISNKLDDADVDNKISSLKKELLDKMPSIPKAAVIEDSSKDILVSLDTKTATKEDILTIEPTSNAILYNGNSNYVAKAYVSAANLNTALKSVSYDNDSCVSYDKNLQLLKGGSLLSMVEPDLYELPLNTALISSNDFYDAAIVGNLLNIVTDYNSFKDNYNNHLINCFNERAWNINREYVTITFSFYEPISLCKFHLDSAVSGTMSKVTVQSSMDGITWTDIYTGPSTKMEFTLPNSTLVKNLKFTIDAHDGISSRTITLNSLKLYSEKYNTASNLISMLQPIILDEDFDKINIETKSSTENSKFNLTKYAITNINENKNHFTYIPKNYTLIPSDFYSSKGYRVVTDSIENHYKFDTSNSLYITTENYDKSPSPSINGTLGTSTITKEGSYSTSNSWLPYGNIIYKASIIYNGATYEIPISMDNIDNTIYVTLGNLSLTLKIRLLKNSVLKVDINLDGENIKVDSLKVDLFGAYNLNNGNTYWDTIFSTMDNYTNNEIIRGIPIDLLNVNVDYNLAHTITAYSKDYEYYTGNISENGACAIIPHDNYSGQSVVSKTLLTNVYNTTYEKRNISLPATIYLGCDGTKDLASSIDKDIVNVERNTSKPVYTFDEEFTAKVYIGNSNTLSAILPSQTALSIDSIGYAISFDNYKYYVFNPDNSDFTIYTNKGMSINALQKVNDSVIAKIRNDSQWIYIKIKITDVNASVQNITLNFDKSSFIKIDSTDILDKGMPKRVIEAISPEDLVSQLFSVSPVFLIATSVKSIYPCYRYELEGFDIYNYMDIHWQEIDNVNVVEYLLGDNSLMYKNNSKDTKLIKVVRTLIENQSAVVDVRNETKEALAVIENNEAMAKEDMIKLKQSIDLMHDTFLNSGTVPGELPDVVLPSIREIELPMLHSGDTYLIKDIYNLRNVQVWEELTSFVGYTDTLTFNKSMCQNYTTNLIDVKDGGAVLSQDYDRDNPYMCPEAPISYSSDPTGPYVYQMFDLSCSVAPSANSMEAFIEDSGKVGNYWGWDYDAWGSNYWWHNDKWSINNETVTIWDLPGEATRWVDVIFDFRNPVYINYLNNLYFGQWTQSGWNATSGLGNQITTFYYSLNGKEYTTVNQPYCGDKRNLTVMFNVELRYLKIRLELPYSVSKGAGRVAFAGVDLYFSPVHYIHNTEAYVFNTIPINTASWLNFKGFNVDRFIDHNPCEMKFLLSDDENHNVWKAWDGSKWQSCGEISLASAMSIETLLSLNKDQLNLLTKGSLYVCAIMETTDIWKTPVLSSVEILHDDLTEPYYRLLQPYNMDLNYSSVHHTLTAINTTGGDLKTKLVIS